MRGGGASECDTGGMRAIGRRVGRRGGRMMCAQCELEGL
jgi:hypothetical protein